MITTGNLKGHLKSGACTGLSLNWVRRHRQQPGEKGVAWAKHLGAWAEVDVMLFFDPNFGAFFKSLKEQVLDNYTSKDGEKVRVQIKFMEFVPVA